MWFDWQYKRRQKKKTLKLELEICNQLLGIGKFIMV